MKTPLVTIAEGGATDSETRDGSRTPGYAAYSLAVAAILCVLMFVLANSLAAESPRAALTTSPEKLEAPAVGITGAKFFPGLSEHEFKITTDSPEAQKWFNQGLILLYGFNHGEAIRSFREAAAQDPKAAMPWWGVAYADGMHINAPEVSEAQWKDGFEAAKRAVSLLDDETDLEQDLVNAVASRTAWPPPKEQLPYDEAFADRMKSVYDRFSDNPDVAVQYVESLLNLQPWDYWTEDLKPKGRAAEFIAVLKRTLEKYPTHPQAGHLYIHALEAGPNPEAAEATADILRDKAPPTSHLVHMPGHIYARVGRYADAAMSNESALALDDNYLRLKSTPDFYYVYHAHNLHFLAFAAMMEANYEPAIAAARRLESAVPDKVLDELASLIEGIIPTTSHVLIRFGKWEEILREKAPPEKRPMMRAIHHYARGIALAALGRTKEARAEQILFENQSRKVPEDWWVFSNKAHDVLPIGRLMLEGEIAYRERRLDDAWAALGKAIELEDKLIYDEPPGWMFPVRHAMGALLMEAGEFKRAERLYREDQVEHPGNGWSLLGLKQSLTAQGRLAEAEKVEPQLKKAWARVENKPTSSCMCAPAPQTKS